MNWWHRVKTAKWSLRLTFFFMGIAAVSASTRFAEIQKNVHAVDTSWGLAIMVGNLGSFVGTILGGKLAHKYGTKKIIFSGIFWVAISQTAYGFANALWQIPAIAFLYGSSYAICNVGANSQGAMIQEEQGRSLMPTFHGSWSVGAALSSIFAGLVAKHYSPELHLTVNSIIAILGAWISASHLLPLSRDLADRKSELTSTKIIMSPEIKRFLFLVSIGSLLASIAETSVSDWSTILLHNNYRISIGLNTLGYTSFVIFQVIGRFTVGKWIDKGGIPKVIRRNGVIGGVGYAVGLFLSLQLSKSHPGMALITMCIAYAILGIGVAPMPPSYVSIAGNIPGFPTTAAVTRMSLIASLGFFIGRGIISILAGLIGLPLALMLAAAALVGSGLLAPTLHYSNIKK